MTLEDETRAVMISAMLNIPLEDSIALYARMQAVVADRAKISPQSFTSLMDEAWHMANTLLMYGDWTEDRWKRCFDQPTYFDIYEMYKKAWNF